MNLPEHTYDVIVIGAGVCGTMIARELSRYKLSILVLESANDIATGSTKANSGIVHGGFAESRHELKGRLAAEGRKLFPQLERELNFGFRVTGSLVVSFDDDREPLLQLLRQGQENGLTDLRVIDQAELREREPHISPNAKAALLCEGAGVCSPWDLAAAAMENAAKNGAELRLNTRVSSAEFIGNEAIAVSVPNRRSRWLIRCGTLSFGARYVVNAAGLHAAEVDALAGFNDFVVKARSGQYILLGQGSGTLVKSVLFGLPGPLGKGILVGPTYQNNLLIGPDAKNHDTIDEATLKSTDAGRLAKVLTQARQLVDGIDMKLAIRSFAGVRAAAEAPGGHLGDFIIGQAGMDGPNQNGKESKTPARPGWFHVAGIQSPGLTASPAIARLVVRQLGDSGLKLVPKQNFDPYRPALAAHLSRRAAALPFAQVNDLCKLPAGDPERILCRCEQVREKDLSEAVERGLPILSTDAAKRRTRAGMGWCQGQFCRPRVAEFLSRELTGERTEPESSGAAEVFAAPKTAGTGGAVVATEDRLSIGAARVEGKDLREL